MNFKIIKVMVMVFLNILMGIDTLALIKTTYTKVKVFTILLVAVFMMGTGRKVLEVATVISLILHGASIGLLNFLSPLMLENLSRKLKIIIILKITLKKVIL